MGAIPVGRSILGYEKLLLSGIPADKLLLGTESEVQLSDLAGNAMVMPVVSAAILAVLCLPAYARKLAEDAKFSLASLASHEAGGGARGGAATFSEGQRVELRCGERWEPANIADVNEDGTYDVALAAGAADAGKMFGGVGAAHVRRRASEGRVEGASAIQRGGKGGGSGAGKSSGTGKGKRNGGGGAALDEPRGEEDLVVRLQALLPLCETAEATSVLCVCETSGGVAVPSIA